MADWQQQWLALSVLAIVFAVPAWLWMPHPSTESKNQEVVEDNPPSKLFKSLMMLAYFCAGYGYAVSSTFIVDIVESTKGLQGQEGQGGIVFLLIGLAATPAALIWDRIARRFGYLRTLIAAYLLQIIGIILPAINDSLPTVIISALLFGGTFIACVSLVLTMAGKFFPSDPAKFMGTMTLSYGAAQIIAPVLTGYIVENYGSYDPGLYLSVAVVIIGTVFLYGLLNLKHP